MGHEDFKTDRRVKDFGGLHRIYQRTVRNETKSRPPKDPNTRLGNNVASYLLLLFTANCIVDQKAKKYEKVRKEGLRLRLNAIRNLKTLLGPEATGDDVIQEISRVAPVPDDLAALIRYDFDQV